MSRVYNFSAGPAVMPEEVLARAAAEMSDYKGTGMSVMEMSHRSAAFEEIIAAAEAKLRALMRVPDGYKVLFIQGGAHLQFSMVAMNLLGRTGKADYAVTGQFSSVAYKEAQKFGAVRACCDMSSVNHTRIPEQGELSLSGDASYMHYCMNNTVFGTLWPYIPDTGTVPLVSDISSCILSEPLDVSRFALLYAGAQKNLGPAGFAVVILREDMLAPISAPLPTYLDYATHIKSGSMYNTPPTYCLYMLGLVLDWLRDRGGPEAMRERNEKKAAELYAALDGSELFTCPVERGSRSKMNVVFTSGNADTDDKFIRQAAGEGLVTLRGHRSVGGMRASIYNAMPAEGVSALADFIRRFEG
ncbi:MAG: 3-phosphoserine/phosphohydroxythreonine transaminase [Oscillospiraceae bacterium]|jgi:phosphoserine aminotransferase|nr:3-phosphoserine/phosphohydroxythreonine transaminase [Oscillospiraceae bacterium]